MNTWNVFLTVRAYKQLRKLPRKIQDLTDLAVVDLEGQGPVPAGWDVRKTGDGEYRIRLTYRYRMRYRIVQPGKFEIEVFYVGHRRDAYK